MCGGLSLEMFWAGCGRRGAGYSAGCPRAGEVGGGWPREVAGRRVHPQSRRKIELPESQEDTTLPALL